MNRVFRVVPWQRQREHQFQSVLAGPFCCLFSALSARFFSEFLGVLA